MAVWLGVITINGYPPSLEILREDVVRTNENVICPISKVNDTVTVRWTQPNNGYTGRYKRIRCTSSLQWEEISYEENDENFSPLLIDMNRDGFVLSKKGVGVSFDILDNGSPIKIQWVAKDTDDAFLVRDLNNNHIIDNGSELFGVGTDLLSEDVVRKATNGYEALSQFDSIELGGNGDGKINRKDNIWNELGVWIDVNSNAITDPNEFYKIKNTPIRSIGLNAKYKHYVDSAGNLLPYWSWVKVKEKNGPGRVRMVDIFFRKIDQ